MSARKGPAAPTIFGLTEPQLLAVALAVAALGALGKAPTPGTSPEIDLTAAPADGPEGRGFGAPG